MSQREGLKNMKGENKLSKKGFLLHTVEHREYFVRSRNLQEAFQVIKEEDITPKSKKVELISMGDFKIVEEEEL